MPARLRHQPIARRPHRSLLAQVRLRVRRPEPAPGDHHRAPQAPARDGGPDPLYVVFENDAYLLDPGLSIWCDAEEMEASGGTTGQPSRQAILTAAAAYERATACYAREYLCDSPYEEWALTDRDRLRLLYVEAANRLGNPPRHGRRRGRGRREPPAAPARELRRGRPPPAHPLLRRAGTGPWCAQYRAYVECAERMYGQDRRPERPVSTSRSSPTGPARGRRPPPRPRRRRAAAPSAPPS